MGLLRPRFSVRTLAVFVTLICVYFGCWEATKRWGVTPTQQILAEYEQSGILLHASISPPMENAPMPFVIRRVEFGDFHASSRFYLWFFGLRIELPIRTEIEA